MTLHLSFPSMYKARYKSTFWKIKLWGLAEAWSPCVFSSLFLSLSLPLPLFFRLIPWSMGAPCVHLSAWVSKTWTGRRSASSLPQETGRAPVASVNRANFLSWSFIGFLCKPRNISLFLPSIFLSSTFFPSLSKSIANTVSPLGFPGSCGGWTPAHIHPQDVSMVPDTRPDNGFGQVRKQHPPISTKFLISFYWEKIILKFIRTLKGLLIAKILLKKKNKVGGLIFLIWKLTMKLW